MSKVVVSGQWAFRDSLDGKELKDSEIVLVRWPDDSTSRHRVIVRDSLLTVNDMGHDYQAPVSKAFIEIAHRGLSIQVRLESSNVDVTRE